MIQIYAFGSNGSGQLALGHESDVSHPQKISFSNDCSIKSVEQLRAGGNHTLLLAGENLYISGVLSNDSIGIISTHDKFSRVRLPDDLNIQPSIVYCAACWEASIFVQKDENGLSNKIYTLGTGNYGELGHGEDECVLADAKLINDFPSVGLEISDLAASVSHVVVVLNNGEVYGWGNGRKGQIGEPKKKVYKPRKIRGLDFKIVRVICGREFTCLLGEPKSGNFKILGSDKWSIISSAPETLRNWKDIGGGWGSIHVLIEDGKIVSWGRNDHGQLAPPDIPRVSHIAIGSEHALGLTMDGVLLAWGWGEHGNCGPLPLYKEAERNWSTFRASECIGNGYKFIGIGAGCATSWIYAELLEN
ncbi:RCC1 repeat-containing protein C10F6.04 [Erysiphe neolycopersici]|uniref:RCC1 repeat-containing protein C10F6.04 n=1 Tax=Erysiphe neolycopersici TaxID=212602 RepID=A0A420HUQ2_9PEZI|nr:RCC1 repeat-containing protein C10F6.04 [Erysiphe neolycopersici]